MENSRHRSRKYTRLVNELTLGDVALVGGKNAALGELCRELEPLGVPVPEGFAITADAYRRVLDNVDAWKRLHAALDGLDADDVSDLARRGKAAREVVLGAGLPLDLRGEILEAYADLREQTCEGVEVAVRSSATAEDLPEASFAGQQDTFLAISGEAALLDACRRCFASLFTDRAIHYRTLHGFDHFDVALSIGVQRMVRSDLAASGVMFSVDTETGYRDAVFITSTWGLGENVVQGTVEPDEFYVHKPTYREGFRRVLRRRLGKKKIRMVRSEGDTRTPTRNLPTPLEERDRYSLSDSEVLELAGYAILIEDHFSKKRGQPTPMDMEWAKDGVDGKLYLLQARPETVEARKAPGLLQEFRLTGDGRVLVEGRAVGSRIGSGSVRFISGPDRLDEFQAGEVLVAEATTPDQEPVMKTAAAIVTERGGRTCHAAIVARELGIPAIVGAEDARRLLHDSQVVTVSCAEGERGSVYEGAVPFECTEVDTTRLPRPETRILINLGNPELAFALSKVPNDGVGLARTEFIISQCIQAHPMALLYPERVVDERERYALRRLARHHPTPADYFVETLAEGVGTLAAAFWPKQVTVRLSDFKTNEYANLLGGSAFEPEESNPMLGFRGAARYVHPAYAEAFALECAAMVRVREDMGLQNVRVMVPFCRSVEEGKRVLDAMARNGLRRGKNGLEIWLMCEIPSNVLQVEELSKLFDGFSIGSNDLTQLTLGADRDSALLAETFDECDPAVLRMIELAIEGAQRNHRPIGICGQGPSDSLKFAQFLVELGIDSISLDPDCVIATISSIAEVEARVEESLASGEPSGDS